MSARGEREGTTRASGLSFPLLAVLVVVLAAGLPGYLVWATPGAPNPAWPGALVLACGTGLRYAWLVADGRPRLMEMTAWLFSYVFMGLAPLAQLRQDVAPMTTDHSFEEHSYTAAVIVGVGSLAFLIASGIRGARQRASGDAPPASAIPVLSAPVRVPRPLAVRILSGVALLFTGYYLLKVHSALFTNLAALEQLSGQLWPNTAVSGVVSALAIMPLLVSFVSLVLLVRSGRPGRRGGDACLLAVVTVVLLVTVNPLNSPRYVFGTVLLAMAASLGMLGTRRRFRVVALCAVLGFVVVFPLADAFRNADTGPFQAVAPETSLLNGDYDAFAQLDNTVLYVERYGITDGRQALGVALFWVPRPLWPDKPVDTGILLAKFRDYQFTNLSAPMWSELYINGSWPAVVAGGFALGWWARSRDDRVLPLLRRRRAPDVLGCILPFYLIFLLRGSLLQAMANFLVILACAWFVTRQTRMPRRTIEAPAPAALGTTAVIEA